MHLGLPSLGRVIKWLLISNLAVFVVQLFVEPGRPGSGRISQWLGATPNGWWQVWRYVTFQFLHGGMWHILLNMFFLYMLGTPLEQRYGRRKFLVFYLACGAAAGVAYVVMGTLLPGTDPHIPLVGASGGVFGVILAAAIYFPHFKVFFLPIRPVAVIIFVIVVLTILKGLGHTAQGVQATKDFWSDFWSQVAHFGGAVTAAVWIIMERRRVLRPHPRTAQGAGQWKKKMARKVQTQEQVDRILDKVRQKGLASLTGRERRILKKATQQQRAEDRRF